MGATKNELAALRTEGVLVPRTQITGIKGPWRLSDGLALVEELQAIAKHIPADDVEWESLLLASNRAEIGIGETIAAIRASNLEVGQREEVSGFHGLSVCLSSVKEWVQNRSDQRTKLIDTLPGAMSAAAFGRSVGIRNNAHFLALAEAGHTPSFVFNHPKTRQTQLRMTDADIRMFHEKFLTLTTMEAEFGLHRNTIRSVLSARNVQMFSHGAQGFGLIWLRSEVEGLF